MPAMGLETDHHKEKLLQLLQAQQEAAAAELKQRGRSRLARLVTALPADASATAAASLRDLPTAGIALGLASVCEAVTSADVTEAAGAVDRAIILLGPHPHLIAFAQALQVPRAAARPGVLGNEEAVLPCLHERLRGDCAAVHTKQLSLEDFRRFFDDDRPVVIRECAKDWRAVRRWRDAQFWAAFAHRTVPVEVHSKEEAFMSIADLISAMIDGDKVYMAQHPLLSQIPELANDVQEPSYTQIGVSAGTINVWMGPAGSGSKLHYDTADNILVQVVGRKTVVLIPPGSSVYQQGPNAKVANFSPVDVEKPDYDRFPAFRDVEGLTVTLEPEDALYIPAHHWHWVRALTSSVSVNFWF